MPQHAMVAKIKVGVRRREISKLCFMLSPHSISKDLPITCLLYTSDAADERSSVDLGGRRILKKKKQEQ